MPTRRTSAWRGRSGAPSARITRSRIAWKPGVSPVVVQKLVKYATAQQTNTTPTTTSVALRIRSETGKSQQPSQTKHATVSRGRLIQAEPVEKEPRRVPEPKLAQSG